MSFRLRLLNRVLHHVEKPRLATVEQPESGRKAFRLQRHLFREPAFATFLPDRLGGVPALWSNVRIHRDGVILYLHGGGYLLGGPSTHRALGARLSELTGLRVCLPRYRLAPEHPFPAAPEDAWAVWQALLDRGYPADRIVIGGDSAGGGLALSLLSRICAGGGPRPAGLFAMSAWTDLTLSGASLQDNAGRDRLLPVNQIGLTRDAYLGGADPSDPTASPLFADYPGCPPVFLQVAETEILRDDSLRMADALRQQGSEAELDLWGDLPHVWPIFQGWLPEADEALDRIARFTTARFPAP